MHDFYARDRTAGRPKRLEAQHRTCEPLHCPVVLLYEVIEIFRVADDDRGLVRLVVVCDGCRVGPTLINRDFLRQSLGANRFA